MYRTMWLTMLSLAWFKVGFNQGEGLPERLMVLVLGMRVFHVGGGRGVGVGVGSGVGSGGRGQCLKPSMFVHVSQGLWHWCYMTAKAIHDRLGDKSESGFQFCIANMFFIFQIFKPSNRN